MSSEISKKIQEIVQSIDSELKKANAIDINNEVIDGKSFVKIIDNKIKELKKLEPMVADEMGVISDRNGANILFHNISALESMRKNISLTPDADSAKEKMATSQQRVSKHSQFFDGIHKIILKMLPYQHGKENA